MKLFSSMSELTPSQRDFSDKVTSVSVIGLAAIIATTCLPAQAQRMTGGGGYNIPTNPSRLAPPPAPAQPTQSEPAVRYGVFSPTGPLPVGRVNVTLDNSFEHGQILGYEVYIQDNGRYGNDQIVVLGPEGKEQIWANCNVTEEWSSFGPNSEQFIHSVVTRWCGWSS
jgi:hypothetical protein